MFNYGIVITFLIVTFVVTYRMGGLKAPRVKVPSWATKVLNFAKTMKFWKWPVGIVATALALYFGAPWVWRNASPAFEAFLAFGGSDIEAQATRVQVLCNAEEEASSVRYSKIVRADTPAVDTIPYGWNLQKWTEEDKLERKFSRSGSFLIETNKVKDETDSVRISFRLHRIIC